jgi:fluoroquinolone resistance protein
MEKNYTATQTFEKNDFTKSGLPAGEYEDCKFVMCNFAEVNLSGITFTDCTFTGCNLAMAKLGGTAFRDTSFQNSKMLGLHFEHCKEINFTVNFDNCLLNLSCFYQRKMKATSFINCNLTEVDFTEAELSGSVFDDCNLAGAVFENTILEKADFRSAFNYTIDPAQNKIKKAKFSATGIAGLLSKYDIEISA